MRHFTAIAFMLLPAICQGEEGPWVPMNGAQITQALTGRTLQYENAWQDFRASGRTLYHAGRDSWGYWRVQGNAYCSQWPPQGLWACYRMEKRGQSIRFVGEGDDITKATYKD